MSKNALFYKCSWLTFLNRDSSLLWLWAQHTKKSKAYRTLFWKYTLKSTSETIEVLVEVIWTLLVLAKSIPFEWKLFCLKKKKQKQNKNPKTYKPSFSRWCFEYLFSWEYWFVPPQEERKKGINIDVCG